jgi:hypothetical protein
MVGYNVCTLQEAINPYLIIKDILKLLIGAFLFVVYARLIYVLLTHPRFKSNIFYKLIVLNGILACICYISYIARNRYPSILYILKMDVELADQWSKGMGFLMFVRYHMMFASFTASLFMALNRMTSIMQIENIVNFLSHLLAAN